MNIDSFIFSSIISHSDFQNPAHPSLALREQDQEVHRKLLLSNSFTKVVMTALGGVNGTVCNAQQHLQSILSYDSRTGSPSIPCLTYGDTIGLVVSI